MRAAFVAIGVIALLVGFVWTLQGADVLLGSVMSGSTFWLGAGLVLRVVGLALAGWGARAPSAKKPA